MIHRIFASRAQVFSLKIDNFKSIPNEWMQFERIYYSIFISVKKKIPYIYTTSHECYSLFVTYFEMNEKKEQKKKRIDVKIFYSGDFCATLGFAES